MDQTTDSTAPTPPAATPSAATIQYDDFAKIDLRVATVISCEPVPKADKLLALQLELAGGERRQILAGIKAHYAPEQMVGKQIIVVANLAPRTMKGMVSHGMLLAAHDEATGKVVVMGPGEAISAGSKVS